MAVKAILEIEGKKYNILEFNYKLHQESGKNGYPCGNVSGGHIIMVLESDKDIETFDWAKSHDAQKEGTISFYKQDGISIFKKLSFREAYCLHFKEEFNSNGKTAMRHTIEISPGDANYDDIHFTKNWSEPVFDLKNASTFVKEEEEVIKYVNGHFYNRDGSFEGKVNVAINTGNVTDVYTCTGKGKATDSKGVEIDVYNGIKILTENGENVKHDVFAKSSNIVCHESSGNKTESLWIAHTANNAHSDNNIDYKRQNNSVHDQLMDKQYSTTDDSARTPLYTTDESEKAKNARAAIINVITGGLDPTNGAVLFDGVDFLKKGLSHNKFNEFITVSINSTILNKFTQNADEIGPRVNPNYTKDSIFSVRRPGDDFKEEGTGKYFSIEATGTHGGSIFWKTIKK